MEYNRTQMKNYVSLQVCFNKPRKKFKNVTINNNSNFSFITNIGLLLVQDTD